MKNDAENENERGIAMKWVVYGGVCRTREANVHHFDYHKN